MLCINWLMLFYPQKSLFLKRNWNFLDQLSLLYKSYGRQEKKGKEYTFFSNLPKYVITFCKQVENWQVCSQNLRIYFEVVEQILPLFVIILNFFCFVLFLLPKWVSFSLTFEHFDLLLALNGNMEKENNTLNFWCNVFICQYQT